MTEVTLNGVAVKFPFKPYKVQEEYMTKVLECLQNSQHGVLESPTGTGKTLSLLCSSLSWLTIRKAQLQASVALKGIEGNPSGMLKDLKNKLDFGGGIMETNTSWNAPRIIYASRTHSQLSQAMQELKRTSYKHVRATVIGSRDQMCIHPEVSKEQNSSTKIHMCQAKIKNRDCYYYNNVETRRNESVFTDEILDIEDLVKEGRKRKCCPYFLTRELKQTADIVFMPYNYLLDPKSRKSQGIDLKDNVILLDEAHNVEKTCEEAASLEITSTDIAMCISEITHAMTDISKEISEDKSDFTTEGANAVQKDFTPEDLMILKTMFLKLEEAIDAIEIKNRTDGETKPGGYIFELLESAQLTHEKAQNVSDKLDKIILYLTTTSLSAFSRKGNALQKFNDLLRIAFVGGRQMLGKHKDCYKVHIQYEEDKKKSYNKTDSWDKKSTKTSEGKVINYWCFSPGFGMQQLVNQGIRSVILTSGTLSPLKPFISEIGIHIAVTLENPHIVQSNQICVGVLSKGPDGHPLNSSFNTRNDPAYINSLGRAILNFSNLIPHGLLVFFPSYPIMNKCRDDWQQSSLWSKIAAKKPIFVEPQSKHTLPGIMNEFYEKIKSTEYKGAIFMAVCRGKVSEGLDFANNNGRAVLITGLPFPPLKDPRVILKKRYLDDNYAKDKNGITGQYWYQLEAMRAVNQAIGRIIRHKDDFGAIILCDCRFENSSNRNQLSTWIRPHIKQFTDFGMVTKELRNFFGFLKKMFPEFESSRVEKPSTNKMMDVSNLTKKRPCSDEPSKPQPAPDEMLKMYLSSTIPEEDKQENSTNLIDALKNVQSRPLFNFNSSSAVVNKSRKPEKSIEEITQTRKKIKLMKVPFTVDNPVPSTSKDGADRTSEEKKTKNSSSNYMIQVKQFLKTSDRFQEFRQMVVDYAKMKNIENVLQQLQKLFLSETVNLELYIGFQSFVKEEHKQRFKEQIELKKAEVQSRSQSN